MTDAAYRLQDPSRIPSPALLYYPDLIRQNIGAAVQLAGGPNRLWPHVKTHKLAEVVRMQQQAGINRFKCATAAEAEMLGGCKAEDILFAYPLVGPAAAQFIGLMQSFPASRWWTVADSAAALRDLSAQARAAGVRPFVLVDVNNGMNRTGVRPQELEAFYTGQAENPYIDLRGLHVYDGHIRESDPAARKRLTEAALAPVLAARDNLIARGFVCDTLVLGGSVTFPCHAGHPTAYTANGHKVPRRSPSPPYRCERRGKNHPFAVYLSPGTVFIHDYGYAKKYNDLPFKPAAAVLTRVVSHPAPGFFTLDLGYKGIAADPEGARGILVGLPGAVPVEQSEEHWVFRLTADNLPLPDIGSVLYVIPTHICPTAALYQNAVAVQDGKAVDTWVVAARNRYGTAEIHMNGASPAIRRL